MSHPGQRVFPPPSFHKQGGQACHIQPGPTKLGCDRGSTERRLGVYLRKKLLIKLFHSRFVCMVLHDFHPINIRPQQLRSRFACPPLGSANFVSTIQFKLTFSPCCSIAFLPNETIALTENPSSKCVLLSRPTRVLSVNPFTGALSHRASTN